MKKTFLLALFLIFGVKSGMAQGLVPNGGDPLSMEFLELARSLPGIIAVKGVEQFSGLDIPKMLVAVNDRQWKIQLGKNLSLDGVRKAALTYADQKLTVVDVDLWMYLSSLSEAKKRKRALVFHEVLVLMKIEFTNDYHLSSRLHGPEVLQDPFASEIVPDPSNGEKKIQTIGRVLTSLDKDSSTEGVFVFLYTDQTVRYVFCKNRYEPETCRSLGTPNHYYTKDQIKALYLKKKTSSENWRKLGHGLWIAITVVAGTAITVATGQPWVAYPFAFLLGGAPTVIWTAPIAHAKATILPATNDQVLAGKTTVGGSYSLTNLVIILDQELLKLSSAPTSKRSKIP